MFFGKSKVDMDSEVTKYVWNEPYKIISIVTKKAINKFVKKYLAENRHRIIGLDCEAGNPSEEIEAEKKQWGIVRFPFPKVASLQLSISDCLFFIDIQLLSENEEMTDKEWTEFFQTIFHEETTIVGFSIINDFRFIYSRFPFIRNLLLESKKMLCLSKLSDAIRKSDDKRAFEVIFENEEPENNSLAALAYNILGLEMDKYYQSNNWTIRPLNFGKKIYAVKDGLIAVLLKEEIQYRLEMNFNFDDALEIMNKGIMKNWKF